MAGAESPSPAGRPRVPTADVQDVVAGPYAGGPAQLGGGVDGHDGAGR